MVKKNMTLRKNEVHFYLVISYETYKQCLMASPSLSFFMSCKSAPVTQKSVLEIYNQKMIHFFYRKLSITKWGELLQKLKQTLDGKEFEYAQINSDGTTEHLATFTDEPKFLNLQISFESKYKFQKVA